MKTVICYETKGQQSVLKLVKAIEEKFPVTLIDVTQTRSANLSEYDLVGFASEIEDGAFYRDIASFAANWMPRDKKIFFLYTAPSIRSDYSEELEGTAHFKNCEVIGRYGCLGADAAGGFRLFGGKNKSHPNEDEIKGAQDFYAEMTGEKPKSSKPETPDNSNKKDEPKKDEPKKAEPAKPAKAEEKKDDKKPEQKKDEPDKSAPKAEKSEPAKGSAEKAVGKNNSDKGKKKN